ncbi:UNVERIFIED_CONTAM: putative anthocyanidin reductase [Sesamum radiatum]|uniref:Anthocyanidin reductase n=1 Tax=Sesamum radiatum TaxID=300843 RepID=A0AAW2VHW9_SESRA
MDKKVKVCVSGGAGYLASFLVKQLLERGYTVHATLRTLGDASKVGLLQGLQLDHHQAAGSRLKLFEADIYRADEFEAAIEGCEFVVHMATPLQHYALNSQYKNTSEAAVGGIKIIMESCMRSNTVKKLIYTASVVAASPLKEDGSGYKDFMDETCWTPLNPSYEVISDYIHSKTAAEKEVLSYNGKGLEVVSLACGLVGGDTIQSSMADSMGVLISQATNDGSRYKVLRVLEDLLAKVPIAHIQDVTEAHIFSMENSHINGRFIEDTRRETSWGSRKLEDLGFQYKCDAEKIIEDSLLCAKRLGNII